MGYLAIGINHITAPITLREKVAFLPDQLPDALRHARNTIQTGEIVILSTCNRTELYCHGNVSAAQIIEWLSYYHKVGGFKIAEYSYTYRNIDAVRHIMRVACGLDSMMLGEPQILGQLKSAYFQAQEVGTAGSSLNRLFQQTFATAKQVRTQTGIGKLPVSIAYATTQLAKQIFAELSQNTALLIGAGKTIQLVARHLKQQGLHHIIVANRTFERAKALTTEVGGKAVLLSELPTIVRQADIIITSTASPAPILSKLCVEKALRERKHQPIFMVDIAVPRDIEPEVGELSDVFLYTVDDLQDVIENNLQQRKESVAFAETLIESDITEFMERLNALDAVSLLRSYRNKSTHLCNQEVQRAIQELSRGIAPEQVLKRMAYSLANKMMHTPSIQLKKAASHGQNERLEWAVELLGLDSKTKDAAPIKQRLAVEPLPDS